MRGWNGVHAGVEFIPSPHGISQGASSCLAKAFSCRPLRLAAGALCAQKASGVRVLARSRGFAVWVNLVGGRYFTDLKEMSSPFTEWVSAPTLT